MHYLKTIYVFVILTTSWLGMAQDEAIFNQGNTLYSEGKYAEAIEKYEQILNSGKHSAALYYNLGNAYYKLNNVASSIYYFEKALQLDPTDREIQNNLTYAQNMTVDAIEAQPEVGFSKAYKSIVNYRSFDTWAKYTIAFMFVFIALFLGYYFSTSTAKKRIAFVGLICALFLTGTTLGLAFQKFKLDKNTNPAIIFTQEVSIKNDPNSTSEELFKLHEGTKIYIVGTFNTWKKIKLPDGKTGWLEQQHIKAL